MKPEKEPANAVVERPLMRRMRLPEPVEKMGVVGFAQVGLFVLVLCYMLHEMKAVLLPLVLAILVSLIVHPVYVAFRQLRIPRMLSALLTVTGLTAALAFGAYQAFIPASEWVRNANQEMMLEKLQTVFRPVKQVQKELEAMADRVEQATASGPTPQPGLESTGNDGKPADGGTIEVKMPEDLKENVRAPFTDPPELKVVDEKSGPVVVEIREDPVSQLIAETRDFGLGLLAFLLMVLFILAYGNRITKQLNRDEGMEKILERMGSDVSRYLFTITMINAGLGLSIGIGMWALGMPRPVLWGVMAMLMNYIPYVGAMTGTIVVFFAAAMNFPEPGRVIAVPVTYFIMTAIEGNLVTPTVLGGHFRINPLVVFVWIFAWAGFWGVAGMLISMPALVIFKIVCENVDGMDKVRRVLSA